MGRNIRDFTGRVGTVASICLVRKGEHMIFKGFFIVGIGEHHVELYRKLPCCGAWHLQRLDDLFFCRCGESRIRAPELLKALRYPPAVATMSDMPTPANGTTEKPHRPKGFAAMDPALQLKICARGGKSTVRRKGRKYMANLGRRGRAVRTKNERKARRAASVNAALQDQDA